jgi:DNA-binding MarR family transcriptional regulator
VTTSGAESDRHWSFVTNHARVLACIAAEPDVRLRDIAAAVGITERTALQIVNDLEQAGYLTKTRDGRRNQYAIDDRTKLRDPRLKGLAANQFLALVLEVFDRQPFG